MIMPFIALISNPDLIHSNLYLHQVYDFLNLKSVNRFIFILGVAVLLLLLISNASAAFINWISLKFSFTQGHLIASRMLQGYLAQPYVFYLTRHSSVLVKNMTDEVMRMIGFILNPFFVLIKALFVTLAILLLLLIIDPMLALIICCILGVLYAVLSLAVRKRLTRLGDCAIDLRDHQIKCLNEALQGIKDIKLLGKEQYVLDEFIQTSAKATAYEAEKDAFGALPRYILEVIAFGGILVIILYLLKIKQDITQVLPLISLYAFAGYRLMPLLQNIIHSLANIRFNMPVMKLLQQELDYLEKNKQQTATKTMLPINFNSKIQFNHVSFAYPDSDKNIINDLSLTIEKNTTVGFVGKTGSGKTTTIDLLLGLLTPTQGEILIDDVPLTANNTRAWQNNIGYVSQHIYLHDTSIAKNIALGVHDEQIDLDKIKYAAKLAHIDDFISNELPQGYQTTVGEKGVRLSGGQRQRIAIARALYHDPDILVFDEATSALDTVTEEAVMQALDSLNHKKTIILIAHRLSTLKNCDQIFTLGVAHT
jgi:ABC-type multidrug transport system fused ATPase/permease subunit